MTTEQDIPVSYTHLAEKVQKWIGNGAQPTDTVKRLLKNKGIID